MPWHWVQAIGMYHHVKNIYERAAYDEDKTVAPKVYWFRKEELDRWYESRKR